jgi:cell division protein FtsB
MDFFSQKKAHRSLVVLYFGFVLLFVMGIFRGETSVIDYFLLKQSRIVLEERVSQLKIDINGLELEIERIKKSKSYAKKILKETYHRLEKDEQFIFISEQ